MKKQIKKLLCAALSLTMVAGSIVLPTVASAEYTPFVGGDTVLNEWKFDFGAADSAPEAGYTLVTPDTNFVTNAAGETQFGFLGIGEEDYKLTNRYDGWTTQKGQVIELDAGGGTGLNDAIGVVGAGGTGENARKDIYGNQGDKYYPTRFAMKVTDDTYYRVRATVTTLDPEKDAKVSLYTERKHPIYTEKTVAAGTTDTVTFSVRVTPIYYEKSTPTGSIADQMLTVGVLGENSALASLEIQQVESIPTLWVLGDSTVTDGNTTLPFFQLQNYTGVGTGLTKYLPRNIAMVNEGEGGLNAADNYHFDMVKSRIKAGDYMYVEYGHNHKSDGPSGYKSCLDKYYNACHEVGAKLLIVSPVQSINSWNSTTKRWNDRFGGDDNFEGAGRSYVEEKVAAGADDIAFVNLTKTSVEFVDQVTADNNDSSDAAKYYYQTAKGGGTDVSHPNDLGAENFAYCFFEAAKEVTDTTQAAVLSGILTDMTNEQPNLVSADVMAGGVGGSAWPNYVVPADEKYPVKIKNIEFNEEGVPSAVDVEVVSAEIPFLTYGIIVITVRDENGEEKGKFYAADQVDHSTGKGPQTVNNFRASVDGLTLEENDTYTAVVLEAIDATGGLQVVEGGAVYSAVYIPTDIVEQLILNEDGDSNENFDFYGKVYDGESASLSGLNGWTQNGSAGITSYLNKNSDDVKYVELASDGAKNGSSGQGSFYYTKELSRAIEAKGRYVISADVQYVSGGGMTLGLVNGVDKNNVGGKEGIVAVTIGKDGAVTAGGEAVGTISAQTFTNIQYIVDFDLGTATVSITGGDPVTVDLANYQTTNLTVAPAKYTHFMFGGSKVEFDNKIANLTVAQLKDQKLPEYTTTVAASNDEMGTVSIYEGAEVPVERDVTIEYKNGKAVVTSTKALDSAVLIEAKYNNGIVSEIVPTTLTLAEAGAAQEVAVTAGSKLMVWNSLSGMKPLANAVEAVEVDNSNALTRPLNTVMTVSAKPNDGYVFMGWSDGTSVVSMDANYSFRQRSTRTLTAQYVVEPDVEDITDFSLVLSNASIKSKVGATTNVSICDAYDSARTPVTKVTNEDVVWACDEAGVTVSEHGVITIGDAFSMGDALTKSVTIKGTVNGIQKTVSLTVFGYEYYEDMSETSTDFDGTFMTIAGKTAIVFPGSSTTKTYKLSTPVKLDSATTLKYNHAWSGSNTCGQKRTLNFKNSSGTTIFSMYYSWGGLFVGGEEISSAIAKDSWSTVTVEIDPSTKVVTVTVGSTSKTTTLVDKAGDIASIDFASDSSVPAPSDRALGISNLTIIK